MTANLTTLQRLQAATAESKDLFVLMNRAMDALVMWENRDFSPILDLKNGTNTLLLACRAEVGKNWGINVQAIVLETVRDTLDQIEAEEAAALNEQAEEFTFARDHEDFGF